MSKKTVRLDQLLVQAGHFTTRNQAQAAIAAGKVRVDGVPALKAGTLVPQEAAITVEEDAQKYVGRGGLKLEHALDTFKFDPKGLHCIDVGASTGGFTDCLLQRGAAKVYAVDVGYGQLDWKLRQDPRVEVRERTNFRYLGPGDLPLVDLVVIDVSFISLTKILPAAAHFLPPGGHAIALIKPQFEAGKGLVGKGGVVKELNLHKAVLRELGTWVTEHGWAWRDLTYSPIKGAKGNIEFLSWWIRGGEESVDWLELTDRVVDGAHAALQ